MRTERITIPYKPRPLQAKLHRERKRFSVIVCHRRFGKTLFAINECLKSAFTCQHPNPRLAYIAPLYRQAKSVAWDYLLHYTAPIPDRVVNQAELRVDFPNGARIQLFGADNPDSLRGMYLDGVVLDEYAQMSGRAWSEVIRPALSDRKGWAIFIGTPQGHNEFYRLYQQAKDLPDWHTAVYPVSATGILETEELEAAQREMSEAEYRQEFECSWSAAIRGAYYSELIEAAEKAGRITDVPYDSSLPVETAWDLGMSDSTVIWFVQRAPGGAIRVIDHYEMTGQGLDHYVRVLNDRGYTYSRHIAPHDIKVREVGSGKSRLEMAASLGIRFEIAPQQKVIDGINAVRSVLPKCWFDKQKCQTGLEALRQYRSVYDDRLKVFQDRPLHDWTSHSADAFRYFAIMPEPWVDDGDDYQQAIGWMS